MKVYSDWREYLYQCLYDYLIVEGITKIASESVDSVYTSKYERNYLSLTFNMPLLTKKMGLRAKITDIINNSVNKSFGSTKVVITFT